MSLSFVDISQELCDSIKLAICGGIVNPSESDAGKTIVTAGEGGLYSTLQEAFQAIWEGNVTGDIVIRIISDITETAQIVMYEDGHNGTANYNSIYIYPLISGVTITTVIADSLILLDGAANVTIDGRVNKIGTKNMVINSGAYKAIEFANSPTNINVFDITLTEGITSDATIITTECSDYIIVNAVNYPVYVTMPKIAPENYVYIGNVNQTEDGTKDDFIYKGTVQIRVTTDGLHRSEKKLAQQILSVVRGIIKPTKAAVFSMSTLTMTVFKHESMTELIGQNESGLIRVDIIDIYNFILE